MSEAATKPDIVVGVDGSDESFAALKWALEEASLTGQSVNAVFGWTHSWDMGSEPDSDEAWAKVRHDIANELRVWVDKAAAGIDFCLLYTSDVYKRQVRGSAVRQATYWRQTRWRTASRCRCWDQRYDC